MVIALGGDHWLYRTTMREEGRTAAFFHNQPNGSLATFIAYRRLPGSGGTTYAERIEFVSPKSMILPGTVRDVAQVFIDDHGYELTYKGRSDLPKEQVADALRQRAHSIETVVRTWLPKPGILIVAEGRSMVERRLVDKVTVLNTDNDAVTLQLDATTHLPLSRTFEARNETFKDVDTYVEEYDDYHTIDGLPTALSISRYRNGDMVNQRYLTKVQYNLPLSNDLFNPDILLQKK
jgi:hypothetical protein